jgi:hypothetical protein
MGTSQIRTIAIAAVAALIAVIAYSPSAHADRRSSLAGNILIEDQDDVFAFPHLATKYVRTLHFDLTLGDNTLGVSPPPPNPGGGPDANNGDQLGQIGGGSVATTAGSAGIILGDESMAIGLFAHRGDTVNNLAYAGTLFGDHDVLALTGGGAGILPGPWPRSGNAGLVSPLNWIDAIVALGDSNLGFRLSIGLNSAGTENDNDGDVTTTSNSAFVANLVVGYGMRGDLDLDVSAEIGFASQSYEMTPVDGDPTTDSSTNIPSISILARGFSPLAKGVDLGFTGLIDFRSGSNEFKAGDNDPTGSSSSVIGVKLGAGPVYTVEDKFIVAATMSAGVLLTSEDPNINADAKDDQSSDLLLLIPELKLSGEFYVTDWLLLRAGAVYGWAYISNTEETGKNSTNTTSGSAAGFRWITGIGLDFDELQINGTLNPEFTLNGPNFIGGGEGTFVLVNLAYNFN